MVKKLFIFSSLIVLLTSMVITTSACGRNSDSETEASTTTETQTTTLAETTTIYEEQTSEDSEVETDETISVEGDVQTHPAAYHTSNLGYTMLYFTDTMKFVKGETADIYYIKNRVTDAIDPHSYVSIALKPNTNVADVMDQVVLENSIPDPIENTTLTINNYNAKVAYLYYTSGTTDFTKTFFAIQDGGDVYLITEEYYYMEGSGSTALLYTSLNTFTID